MQEMEASGLHVLAVVGTDPLPSESVAVLSEATPKMAASELVVVDADDVGDDVVVLGDGGVLC